MSRVFNPTNMTTDAIAGGVAEGLLYMANSAATKNQAQPCAEGEISKNAKLVKNLDESGDRYRDLRIQYHADPDSKHIIGQLDEIDLNDLDTEVNRPSWSDSESTGKVLFSEYKSQHSFKNTINVEYGTKGSVRPDEFSKVHNNSIDVKNYNLMSNNGITSLGRNIVKQYGQRVSQLPLGTKQSVLVDIRGQQVDRQALSKLDFYVKSRTNSEVEFIYLIR